MTEIGPDNPKNYQIWFHRRWVVEKSNDYSQELAFTAQQIAEDSKNYHAWGHRQWTIETFSLWDSELEYTDELLASDLRNNSAWNQRYFIITRKNTQSITQQIRESEIEYALKFIQKAPNNPSPWNYLKGLFLNEKYSSYPSLKQTLLGMKEKYVTSPYVRSLLVDIYQEENTKESEEKALELITELSEKVDILHKKYWEYRKNIIHQKAKREPPNKTLFALIFISILVLIIAIYFNNK